MMLLKFSPLHLDGKIDFNKKYKDLTYNTSITFFPFLKSTINYENTHIENINIPLAHFEFNVLDIEESLYLSFFLMSGNFLNIIEENPKININKITEIIAKETGYLERINNFIKETYITSQLSFF